MIPTHIHPNKHLFTDEVDMAPTRDGFGKGVVEAGEKNSNVVVLCADLADSTRAQWFKDAFPERYIEIGVAEQNLATVASGLAAVGKIPFITSYAAFNPGRNYEQIRTTVALNHQPVKVCGMHAGVSVGPDGATHQMLEDVGLMRMLPNMVVVVPADSEEARKATAAVAENGSPSYLRFGREKTPIMTTPETPFELGRAYALWLPEEGRKPDVAIFGIGALLHEALKAAEALERQGVHTVVINSHTVKPLDTETLLSYAREAGAVVTVEEHQAAGGFGSAVSELLAEQHPIPVEMVAVRDVFGQSGEPDELIYHYGLDAAHIQAAAERALNRKK